MAKQKRSDDWGFPALARLTATARRGATKVRLCDREGCNEVGDRPAPKAPNSPERWYFCEAHAAEYNKNWDYFAGLEPRGGRARAQPRRSAALRPSASPPHWQWGGPGDGSRSRDEMRALDVLELDPDAEFKDVKAAYRRLAKEHHPDTNAGNAKPRPSFQKVQAAYEVLRRAEERKQAAKAA